jgi:hypothetical protein
VATDFQAGNCMAAEQAVVKARGALLNLPSSVDGSLRARLQAGVAKLSAQVPATCGRAQTQSQPPQQTESTQTKSTDSSTTGSTSSDGTQSTGSTGTTTGETTTGGTTTGGTTTGTPGTTTGGTDSGTGGTPPNAGGGG